MAFTCAEIRCERLLYLNILRLKIYCKSRGARMLSRQELHRNYFSMVFLLNIDT